MNCKVCKNLSGKNPTLSFFRFPSDYNRCREWAERCNILPLFDRYGPTKLYKSFRICSDHFDSKDIVFDGRKKKLVNNAVPNAIKPKKVLASPQVDTNRRVTQKLLENLCRFCAEENTQLTDIFSWKGKTLKLEEKIKVFPVTVNKLDKLPLKICDPCIVKISKFYDFFRNCVKADIRLKTILGIADDVTTNDLKSEAPVKFEDDAKPIRNEEESQQKPMDNNLFLYVESDDFTKQEVPNKLKDENYRCSQSDSTLHTADGFSYITSEEHVLLTKSNDVLGKKISFSSEGDITLDRYICNVCSKTFNALEILESHWKAHSLQPDEQGRFMCQNCNKLFPNKYRLNEHNRVHTGEYPFKCTICDKKFHKMALLKQHSIVHESIKRFICSICNLRSSRKGNLIQHLRTHYGVPKKENWKSRPNFRNKNQNKMKLICGTCQMQFLDLETLEQHFKSHTTFSAETSVQAFNTDCDISHLDRTVTKPKPNPRCKRVQQRTYQCEECGVRFKRKDTLTNHVRIHTGERPFVCGSCGFAFKQKGDCLKHERNHQKRSGDLLVPDYA